MTTPGGSDERPFLSDAARADEQRGPRGPRPPAHPGGRLAAGALGAALAASTLAAALPGGVVATILLTGLGAVLTVLVGHLVARLGVPTAETSAALGYAGGLVVAVLGIGLAHLVGPSTLTPAQCALLLVVPVAALVGPLAAATAGSDRRPHAPAHRISQSGIVVLVGTVLLAVVSPTLGGAQTVAEHRARLATAVVGTGVLTPVLPELDGFEPVRVSVEHADGVGWVVVQLRPTGNGSGSAGVRLVADPDACDLVDLEDEGCEQTSEPGVQLVTGARETTALRSYATGVTAVVSGDVPASDAIAALASAEPVGLAELAEICEVFLEDAAGPRCG